MINQPARGKTCDAILGIVEEGKEIIKDFEEFQALALGLPAGAQTVEHYEMSRYSTLRTWAAQIGLNDAIDLLEETLGEEKKTDELLTELADASVN
jgi:ferritin-like metal-binding protein YciE